MWEKYEEKVYTENTNIDLKNFDKTEKLLLMEKNKKTYV